MNSSIVPDLLKKYEREILTEWLEHMRGSLGSRTGFISDEDLSQQSRSFLALVRDAALSGNLENIQGGEWAQVRDMLSELSRARARMGFTPSETATFVLSLKLPIFARLRHEAGNNVETLTGEIWRANQLIDKLGLWTMELYQKGREEVISRQQQELFELSTPVIKLWEGVLALPLIGTLDSQRTQVVMESLLQKIVDTGSSIAIIDITGVPTVDTLVAQHLLKTVAAARLMGADCIISGIRPQIAQTIVHLGVELTDVVTKASLSDAFLLALQRLGMNIVRNQQRQGSSNG